MSVKEFLALWFLGDLALVGAWIALVETCRWINRRLAVRALNRSIRKWNADCRERHDA